MKIMREDLIARCRAFAVRDVASRPELLKAKDFPDDLWSGLRDAGLLGIGLPVEYGGDGGDFQLLSNCCAAIAEGGGILGVAMTWMGHQLNARLHIARLGTDAQKAVWLPRFAAGETTLCVAISEPGAGAHPKRLKTTAVRDGNDYVLNGEKSYLTNGPLAGVFLVLAITGEKDGRKQFSAFLVPRDSDGFEQTPGIEIDFLHPSPHCGIKLTDCRVPAGNMLGSEGKAFDEISLAMRAVEDAVGTASKAGAMSHTLNRLAGYTAGQETPEMLGELGRMSVLNHSLSRLAAGMAADIDAGHIDGDYLNPLSAGFREIAKDLQNRIDSFINEHKIMPDEAFELLQRDMKKSQTIAQSVHQTKAIQYGQTLIAESTSP